MSIRVRGASIRDLGGIEQLYTQFGGQLSPVAPPARLWSLVSRTLSALLPLYQESILYVAEDHGRLVGFVQASARPGGINLSAAKSLQVLNLCVSPDVGPQDAIEPLLDALANHALGKGVARLFVRLPLDDPLTPAIRMCGFRQYAVEQILYAESPTPRGEVVPFGLRPARGKDDPLIYQLYRKVTPPGVSHVEAPTFREWKALRDDLSGTLWGRGGQQRFVVDRVEIAAWLRLQKTEPAQPSTLSFLALPEARLPDELVDHALTLLGAPQPVWTSLRHYDLHMIDALRGRGFSSLLTQSLLVRELAVRVPVREKGLVPSFG
jgi:N-acetylglutamate synthase-like GNAT family acetyltransferase